MRILNLLIACILLSNPLPAQVLHLAGDYEGSLNTGAGKLRLVLHITQKGDSLSATMDSPDQSVKGLPFSSVSLKGDSLMLGMIRAKAAFAGKLINDSALDGIWAQGGAQLPLTLYKARRRASASRRQEPMPPFPYASEEVSFTGGDKDVSLAGTLTSPFPDMKRHPAILLVTGSGAQNRDEEMFGHKPFLLLADFLTRRGYIVLRVDDRGYAQSTGSRTNTTTADYANDAAAGIDFLKKNDAVDKSRIGVIGHSEGGLIAEMLAAERRDIDFIILLAGPGQQGLQLMAEQNYALIKQSDRLSEQDNVAYIKLYKALLETSLLNYHPDHVNAAMNAAVDKWKKDYDTATILRVANIHDEASQQQVVGIFSKIGANPWMHYFLLADPQIYLKKISCKVLALNGGADVQVVAKTNLAAIRSGLTQAGNRHFKTEELPGLNHLFQSCKTCMPDEYKELEETMSVTALTTIGTWLDKEVGN